MPLRNHCIRYTPKLTYQIFLLVWDKLVKANYDVSVGASTIHNNLKSTWPYLVIDGTHVGTISNCSKPEISIKDFLGYDPFVKRTTIETWLEETKAKNLSFGQLREYINYGTTCPYEEVYSKLKGYEIKDKAKILFDKWNTSKEFILPAKWHIQSNDAIDSVLVNWRGEYHTGSADSSILVSGKCWVCTPPFDFVEITFDH